MVAILLKERSVVSNLFIEDGLVKVERLKHVFAELRPNPDRLRYLELRLQGLSAKDVMEAMSKSDYEADLLQCGIAYWLKKIEPNEDGTLNSLRFNNPSDKSGVLRSSKKTPLRQRMMGGEKAIAPLDSHCKVSLKDELRSRRLELFLISQDIQCTSNRPLNGLLTAEILITDDLELASRSKSSVVLLAVCFESLPDIKSLIGCISIPFSFNTIAANLKAIIRRVKPQIKWDDRVIKFGDLEINQLCIRVEYQGSPINLTARQFRLVERLAQSQGDFVAFNDISIAVWEDTHDRVRGIAALASQVRRKGIPIRPVRGRGYAIAA